MKMLSLRSLLVTLFLIASSAHGAPGSFKECGSALDFTRRGFLTLTQDEPTDLRFLPGSAVAQIVKTLRGHWIQVTTRQIFPTFATQGGYKTSIVKILDMREIYRFGRPMIVANASVGQVAGVAQKYSDSPNSISNSITTELNLNDIVSIQLLEDSQVTIPLNNYNDPKLNSFNNKKLDEKIHSLAEGDSDATLILSQLSSADYPKINDKPGTFDSFMTLLDSQNLRGRQLVSAFRVYARKNPAHLILGVVNEPSLVTRAIEDKNKNEDIAIVNQRLVGDPNLN